MRLRAKMDLITIDKLGKVNPIKKITDLGLSEAFENEILTEDSDHHCEGLTHATDMPDWIIDKMNKKYRNLVAQLRYLKDYASTGVQAEQKKLWDGELLDEELLDESMPVVEHFQEAYEDAMRAKMEARNSYATQAASSKPTKIKPYNPKLTNYKTEIEKVLMNAAPSHVKMEEENTTETQTAYHPGLRIHSNILKV
ncbi:hypothetical protein NHQ30_001382 [Ciborinia camelliae]|nr:hypothetical protein NHQ30_001382 [Ciborinia camelliae]